MKLELKHLAPYLPYGLKAKFQSKNKKTCRKYVIGTISVMYSDCSICCYDTVNATPDQFKPLLHPKSIINDTWLSEVNCDLHEQFEIEDFVKNRIGFWDLSYNVLELLYSRHIDVFGLIDEGLALPLI